MNNDLLNSERKELLQRIRLLQEEKEIIATTILHEITRIINTHPSLSDEQQSDLLTELWRGRK